MSDTDNPTTTETVLVAGSHGQVGQHVTKQLAEREREGYHVRAMVRKDSQVDEMESMGAAVEAVVADLTDSVEHAVDGCNAIIFAAGSGGEDVYGVDRDGAIRLVDAAADEGIGRFVMLSSMGTDDPKSGPEPLQDYLIAKAEADEYLRKSDLSHTIVRPGELTTAPGTGEIRVGTDFELGNGDIPREDVASVLVRVLEYDRLTGETFELLSGDDSIDGALGSLAEAGPDAV
ncbi:homolog to NAD-dependent epimerase/dehydratase [Natrialba magadii ATCC 43099]|uniref:NAD-dependent epimerase/dehydratase n=1 Tax=Natrialba magadii (strain ATCC 43099 / DSM 3394 / CCM 3739 / CIP 104546 / IAM 13178 / JCM 8861 / NBRC 102185 / NCIMB 2190 / MS3) TaxID=547559 RepID=D3SWY9_NATMM|nr:SDR family oxidoreductase [Natrialba magadii]ADD05871.1 homolog to NAD-dependent epimerase/dehydratase [Natrialba magadii ATCC 43099]ELY30621.1 NAD-dependent epimerase/dehydratase [Natrialba magadii ATCC 43099]